MTTPQQILGLLITLAAMWHVAGFGFGMVYVRLSLLSLLGKLPYDRHWTSILRNADVHLWLSGFALIGLGIWSKGLPAYTDNPKLWCKIVVILMWFLSTQLMRFIGVKHLRQGNKKPMLYFSATNISCWIYGAFLGCAKPLAYGAVPFSGFLAGFIALIIMVVTILHKSINTRSS